MRQSPSTTFYGRSHAARVLCVSPDTLLNYEDRGIVKPVRDASGKRLYSTADIESVRQYRMNAALAAAANQSARKR